VLHAIDSTERRTHVDVLPRGEFLDKFGDEYSPGQHVTLLGPTQRGKTTLAHQCLATVISPDLPCVLLAGKPPGRDPVMAGAAENLNLRIVEEWPPGPDLTGWWKRKDKPKTNGFVLRPHQTMTDPKADSQNVAAQFRKALISGYASNKPSITVADEAHLIQNEYKLKTEYEAPLMRGAPVNSMWSLIQRGRYMSYLAYDAPEWFLIAYDPDEANQKRYAEMGGVDPQFLRATLKRLRTYRGADGRSTISEFLCIRRSGPQIFIVDVA
jgi:hypothetical protein